MLDQNVDRVLLTECGYRVLLTECGYRVPSQNVDRVLLTETGLKAKTSAVISEMTPGYTSIGKSGPLNVAVELV